MVILLKITGWERIKRGSHPIYKLGKDIEARIEGVRNDWIVVIKDKRGRFDFVEEGIYRWTTAYNRLIDEMRKISKKLVK